MNLKKSTNLFVDLLILNISLFRPTTRTKKVYIYIYIYIISDSVYLFLINIRNETTFVFVEFHL